jgi:hypothetical protein
MRRHEEVVVTLDPVLLEKARAAADSHAEADRQLQSARGDYYHAIRKLHLAGGSVREIADALGVSHQRVQQMVQTAGGSWWQRLRGRRIDPVAVCTFCDRPPSAVSKLVAGPAVYICDRCIRAAERVMAGGADAGGALRCESSPRARCSFCDIQRSKTAGMVAGPAAICADCLTLCRQIIDERS